jgi:hypothetical protein
MGCSPRQYARGCPPDSALHSRQQPTPEPQAVA